VTGPNRKRADPWIDIVGIGEDGLDGLNAAARECLAHAEIIIGGDRHHNLSAEFQAERISWPSPFDAMIEKIQALRGKRLVILVTGDPLWYSVGARIARAIDPGEMRFHPQISAFQWASCRMGWSLADCETVTVHGRADNQILPHLAPNVRLLLLTQDAATPAAIAKLLCDRGFDESRMIALAALGGSNEKRYEGVAKNWSHAVPNFHVLAIECVAGDGARWYPRTGGLPDHAYTHDGQLTKQDIRSATLAKLAPYPDALLWDVGAGCGSISIEWMRAARGARAVAVEHNSARVAMILQNARELGTEKLDIIEGHAPKAIENLPRPDAVFIGGGLSATGMFEKVWQALRPGGRLVANVVTLESEMHLIELHKKHGGDLVRIAVHSAGEMGRFRAWRPAMPVTQWSVIKPFGDVV